MAKTSKTVSKKDKASSSSASPNAWAPQAVPDLEDWVQKLAATSSYDEHKWRELSKGQWEAKNHSLGDAFAMRPAPTEEKAKPSNSKSEKDKKRKRVSKPEDSQDKKTPSRRLKKRFAQTGADLARDSPDDEENDNEESALVTRTRKLVEAAEPFKLETSSRGEETSKEEAGRAPVSPEAIVKFRVELSQCEAELKKVSGEEKALRLLYSQKEEELKDLRTALAKAQKSESELDEQVIVILTEYNLLGNTSEANTLISQLQQKLDMIRQLWGEVDQVRADCLQRKKNMDQLVADKEAVVAQLASAETQLRGIEAKGRAQASKIEDLEAELAKARAEATQAKVEAVQDKAEAEKVKVEADKSIDIYLRETATIQAELREASYRGK
uniref:Eukaryotic translation initiation factor 5B-like n=1 Tax=Nicotiana sylvestris TaxID=4096 RepID=A0A1U7WL77_NICSY|nr:PREDICTED: eukaryotic translation initiation factor 5B-like [Nicotiana sylvestris]